MLEHLAKVEKQYSFAQESAEEELVTLAMDMLIKTPGKFISRKICLLSSNWKTRKSTRMNIIIDQAQGLEVK